MGVPIEVDLLQTDDFSLIVRWFQIWYRGIYY